MIVLKEKYSEVVPPFGGATSKYFGERVALGGAISVTAIKTRAKVKVFWYSGKIVPRLPLKEERSGRKRTALGKKRFLDNNSH